MALEDGSPQFDIEPVARPPKGRLPALLIAVAGVFVVIAVVKPWPAPAALPESGNHPIRTAPSQASAQPTAQLGESGFFQQCFPTANWRLTTVQSSGATAVRTVWPAAPATAVAKADADPVHVYGDDVDGIGFCAPGDEQQTRVDRAATVTLWRRDASGAIVQVDGSSVMDTVLAAQGEVYLAPPTPLADHGQWPAGDYFFEINSDRVGSSPTWMALRVVPLPTPGAGARPTSSPAPS